MRSGMRMGSGFTLVELMISMAILVVIVTWLMGAFTTQHQTYIVVDEVAQAQGNARAVADLIESDLQKSGFKVPEQAAVCGLDNTNATDILFVSATDVLRNVDATLPLNMLVPDWTADRAAAGLFNNTTLGLQSVNVDGAGSPTAVDFVVGGGVIVLDEDDNTGRVACGRVDAIAGNTLTWTRESGVVAAVGSRVAIPAHRYAVDGTARLTRDGVVLIEDVEDFQVAYFVDTNSNNLVDPGETHGDGQGATPTYDPNVANGFDVREVRINLVVRTKNQDPRQAYTEGAGQVTENRIAASLPAQDAFRRRVHTASVRVRNVGTR